MTIADKIALWSMIGSWVSGIATFLAVLVSLYLGLRKPNVTISALVGERVILGKNYLDEHRRERGLSIKVTNQSPFPVKITSIYWYFKRENVLHQLFGDINSAALPHKLDFGEEALFWVKFSDDDDWIARFARSLKESSADPRNLRCAICVSTGKVFYFKPEKEFWEKIINKFEDI